MNKLVAVSFFVLVASLAQGTVIKSTNLRDIIDEAKQQLEELKAIVQGDISAARDELNNQQTDFFTFSDNVIKDGSVALQQEHETILGQITTLKELGHSAGKDISTCLEHREEAINRLPGIYAMESFRCVRANLEEVERIVKDSKYIIDVNINKVHDLEHQLNRCGDSILCIEPVVTEIQLDMIRLPASIKSEVTATKTILNNLQIDVQGCSDIKVTEYVSNANSILKDITDCVNDIIG